MSSNPVTAVLHHNREEWTHVKGYKARRSYNGEVGSVTYVGQGLIKITSVNLVAWSMNTHTLEMSQDVNNIRKS